MISIYLLLDSILTHCKYLLAYISDAPKRWKWSRVEQIPFPTRLEGHFRRKFHFQRDWKPIVRTQFHFQRGWKPIAWTQFHFQRDWKAISGGNSISNAVGSLLRGRNGISNVFERLAGLS